MECVWQNIRYALRVLGKNYSFAFVVVFLLAIGIGVNTAVFSVINAVMLRPLSYKQADRLVFIYEKTKWGDFEPQQSRFRFWRQQNEAFDEMAGLSAERLYVTGIDKPRQVRAGAVTSNFFSLLGVQPQLGRSFLPEEEQPGNDRVLVVSHTFWQNDLGGTKDAIGRTMNLNDKSYVVVGVLPVDFQSPVGGNPTVWVPLVSEETESGLPGGPLVFTLARLKSGLTLERANTMMVLTANRLKQEVPGINKDYAITVQRPLNTWLRGKRKPLFILLGAAGLVLLITCVSVANLFLTRSDQRQDEMTIRLALGATRGCILRQMITESLLFTITGGGLGLLLAFCTVRGLIRLCPADIPRLNETNVDWLVLSFTFGVSILMGMIFGIVPVWGISNAPLAHRLKEGITRSSSRHFKKFHGGLVVAQVGISLILLIGATLLIQSLIILNQLDLGFQPGNALVVDIALPEMKYAEPHECQIFYESLLQRIRPLPHVQSAGVSSSDVGLGIGGEGAVGIRILGHSMEGSQEREPVYLSQVSPGYLEALGIKTLKGRTLTEDDVTSKEKHIIIDEYLARKHFRDTEAIGQIIEFPGGSQHVVVGVVSTVKDFDHLDKTWGMVYIPIPEEMWYSDASLLVRTDGDPLRLIDLIRSRVVELTKDPVITKIETLDGRLANMLAPERFIMILLTLFAGIALVLAMASVYGQLQYTTTQQIRDIGIRMSLGATPRSVLMLVLRQGFKLVIIGVVIGLAGALALTRVLSSFLYGVSATDPWILTFVSILLVSIALLASYLPARRATRIDLVKTLRYE
jgi:putative ABC transport system permease protein